MKLPLARGPVSAWLIDVLSGPTTTAIAAPRSAPPTDPLADEDLHLSLSICYALHAFGVEGVDDAWEWAEPVLRTRRQLETWFEAALREHADVPRGRLAPGEVPGWLVERSRREDEAPSLSRFLARDATDAQFREFVIHRSLYTLHEADPHTFVIPRLRDAPKAALVEIQIDEYGGGALPRMHARLFAKVLETLGLDATPDAFLDRLPGSTLATVNLVWMFGLQRRLRGAAVGHLAMFELTSAVANREYGNGLRRLGYGADATHYYDEHVEADSVHDMIAAWDVAGGLALQEPPMASDIVFGAAALDLVERRFADALLGAWGSDRSSLRPAVSAGERAAVAMPAGRTS